MNCAERRFLSARSPRTENSMQERSCSKSLLREGRPVSRLMESMFIDWAATALATSDICLAVMTCPSMVTTYRPFPWRFTQSAYSDSEMGVKCTCMFSS